MGGSLSVVPGEPPAPLLRTASSYAEGSYDIAAGTQVMR